MGELETQELGGPPLKPKAVLKAPPLRIPEQEFSFSPFPSLAKIINDSK
jgi:hypothetical protein